jgi:hypothetical protein
LEYPGAIYHVINRGNYRADVFATAGAKVAIALRLKETTQAGNRWLAEHLNMGRAEAVSVYVGRLRTRNPTESGDYLQLTTIVST